MKKEEEKKNKHILKKWFFPYLAKHKVTLVMDLFCAALTTLAELILPMIVRKIANVATTDISQLTITLILSLAGLYAVLKIIDMLAGYYMSYVGHCMGVKIERDMREDMFSHLLTLPFSFFDTTKVGQLMSRITTDMFDVAEFAHHCPEEFFIAGLKIVVSFGILGSINLLLTVISFLVLPLMYFGTLFFRKQMHNAFQERRVQSGEINSGVETTLLGIKVVKSFANEDIERSKFKVFSDVLANVQFKAYKFMARLNMTVRFFDGLMYLIMIIFGGIFLRTGKITGADFTAYLLYIAMLIAAVKRIVEFTEQFEKGTTGIERFSEIMEEQPEKGYGIGSVQENVKGDIELHDVTFSYNDEDDSDILENINLKIKAGENVAIVGPSGSGKTTMCSLISRFYELKGGKITLDGKDISELSLSALRNTIGVVQQDVYLFSGTIMENIKYGNPNATDEQAKAAAKLAGIDKFVDSLPNGYDTYVGERGTKLSGGQKQRISIARVFVKNPPILVLDEATSALDNESEQHIKESLKELAKGRTTFTIAHRLSTIRNASRIIVLTKRGIEEQGTHEQLMKLGGIYAKLNENVD